MSGKKGVLVMAAVAGILGAGLVGCAHKKTDGAKMEKNSCKGGGSCKGENGCKGGGSCKSGSSCKSGGGCGKNACG